MTNINIDIDIDKIIKKLDLIKASLQNKAFNCEMLASLNKVSDEYLQALRSLKD